MTAGIVLGEKDEAFCRSKTPESGIHAKPVDYQGAFVREGPGHLGVFRGLLPVEGDVGGRTLPGGIFPFRGNKERKGRSRAKVPLEDCAIRVELVPLVYALFPHGGYHAAEKDEEGVYMRRFQGA